MSEETQKNPIDKAENKEPSIVEAAVIAENSVLDKGFHFEDGDIEKTDNRNREYKEARESRSRMGLSPEPETTVSEQQYLADAEKYIETERNNPYFPIGTAVGFTMLLANKEEALRKYPERGQEIEQYFKVFDEKYRKGYTDALEQTFNAVVAEYSFKWEAMAGPDGKTDYSQTDKVMEFLEAHTELSNNFRGHTVFWNRTKYLPEYLKGKPKEEIREEVMQSRLEVLKRYPDIKEWDLLNEPLLREPRLNDKGVNQDEVVFDPEKDFDFFVELFKRAKEIAPNTKLYVNEYSILTGSQTGNYIKFIQRLVDAGAPVDGIGVQGHIFNQWEFASISQIKENLDDLAKLGLPIKITELDVSDEVLRKMYFPANAEGITDEQLEGARADYAKKAMTIFYGNPKVSGIYLWGFQDKSHWRGKEGERCGLFDGEFHPNRVGRVFQSLTQDKWKINVGNKNHS